LSGVLSALISLLLPNVYQSSALISQATINKQPMESASAVYELMKNPSSPYLREIAAKIGYNGKSLEKFSKSYDISERAGYIAVEGRAESKEKARKLTRVICDIILARQNSNIKYALDIADKEMQEASSQALSVNKEIERLDRKIAEKDKTSSVAQSYVLQALIEAKENALKRQSQTNDRLRNKEMEAKYFTMAAMVIGEANLPDMKIAPQRRNIVIVSAIVGFMFSVFLAFVVEYYRKTGGLKNGLNNIG